MKRKVLLLVVVFFLALVSLSFFFLPGTTRSEKEAPFIVRVRIVQNAAEPILTAKGNCAVLDTKTGKILKRAVSIPKDAKISSVVSGIGLGKNIFNSDNIRISPLGSGSLAVNGIMYRGEIDVVKKEHGFDIINRVKLEDYLRGVVPREVNHLWPFAAIKAQAIASRSFAVFEALRRRDKGYDLRADTFSQVYGGRDSERWRTTRAVLATRGKVLEYGGKIFPAYFHSCCGGQTEDALGLWSMNLEPLKGVRCPWCRWSPHFRWMRRIQTDIILEKLKNKGYDVERIDRIKAGKRNSSGRLEYVSIKSRNRWTEIKAEDFCSAVGKRELRSTNFRIKKYPFFYLFSGHGWGHGVGMCQWGAFGLSLRRRSAERILAYYYPKTKIVNLSEVLKQDQENETK